jgi:SAM-dependent methyltransferase
VASTVPTAHTTPHLEEVARFFDRFAAVEPRWRRQNRTYHRLIASVSRFMIPPGSSVLEIGSGSGDLLAALEPSRGLGVDVSEGMVGLARERHPELEFEVSAGETFRPRERFDYVLLSDLVPFADDLLAILERVAQASHPRTRIVLHSYSQLWRPAIRLAELLRLKPRKPIRNWVTPGDVSNMLELVDLEVVTTTRRILLPKKVPLLSAFLNGVVASLWPFKYLCLTYWVVARPRPRGEAQNLSASVIVPCRNEAGNIADIVARVPDLGRETEIVFVEGGSTDGTREEIERQIAAAPGRPMSLHIQRGKGKADAVRLGFSRARNDVVMILDADLTVPPEELPRFFDALARGRAEFVNGSRLVYDLEPGAMQFLNIFGNKFFSWVFSTLLDQHVKDTLCGTKALLRSDWEALAEEESRDPFGDFELLLGAGRLGLKIVDLPVRYRARTYGRTNISRFRHGWLLLRMSVRGFRELKMLPVRV